MAEHNEPKQTVCERCGEPCDNAKVCATCLAREPQPEAAAE